MSFEYLADPQRPAWSDQLPGRPEPYFLAQGEGSTPSCSPTRSRVSGDETAGQFGMFTATCPSGDIIPTHAHADTHETFYIVEGSVRLFVRLADGEKVSRVLTDGDFGFVPA